MGIGIIVRFQEIIHLLFADSLGKLKCLSELSDFFL